ncbi:MAG: 16S rRNA (guanine(966)-N(2))-methyltransferase RsmD [Pseudomonadota bacterium]|nr:16S rRNA (guanine(966)-N(2))-methyltransferase RsmD [Pseudomonadota bacterium]
MKKTPRQAPTRHGEVRQSSSLPATAGASNGPGKVRVIGGRWRGTRLAVAAAPGLRPTSDRVRETLFNWLAPMLPGARVLDLFAGSGALGLEAVSRGAASAVLVERDPALASMLRAVAGGLAGGDAVSVGQSDAQSWLISHPDARFDLAFVDPPFDAGLWDAVLPSLLPQLVANAWLYVESPVSLTPHPGDGFLLHREGRTREVRFALYRRVAPTEAAAVTLPADPAGTEPASKLAST